MNRPMFKKILPLTLVWAMLVILCGVISVAQEPAAAPSAAAEVRTDNQIEMDVVHALDSTQALKSELISPSTIQGEVTLSGTVTSDSNRKLAETIAGGVAGVTKVNDNLKVVGAQTAEDTGDNGNQEMDQPQPAPNQGAPNPGAGQPVTQDQIRAEVQAQIQAQRQAQLQTPSGPLTVPPGTLLKLRTNEPVGSKRAKDGQPVEFTLIQTVAVGGMRAIPRGATFHGVVTEVKQSGALEGKPVLALTLTSLELGGQSYPITTGQFKVRGPGKGARSANNMIGGTLFGAIIGCAAGRGAGCAIGAGAGLAAGTAASAATPGPGVWIPAEALVEFHLTAPLTVNPVSAQEAARLAEGLYQGGPNLYQRGYYPYGQPYPYGYPPVYYRPYYAVGGYYYWR
ncbi:MAG: BON domain-containing protein [Terracidiphilus sp.]